jgi:hypothetical protein
MARPGLQKQLFEMKRNGELSEEAFDEQNPRVFGTSARPPQLPSSMHGTFSLFLHSTATEIPSHDVFREISLLRPDLDMRASIRLAMSAPVMLVRGVSRENADHVWQHLALAGCYVDVRPEATGGRPPDQ